MKILEYGNPELENFYFSQHGNRFFAMYGMSMGGVFASQIWQNKKIVIDKLIMESSRIENEEIVLEKGLEGYDEYKKAVKYKIIPFVW